MFLLDWEKDLLETDLDARCGDSLHTTIREKIALNCERVAMLIRNMKYRTVEEFKKNNSTKCPQCGRETLTID